MLHFLGTITFLGGKIKISLYKTPLWQLTATPNGTKGILHSDTLLAATQTTEAGAEGLLGQTQRRLGQHKTCSPALLHQKLPCRTAATTYSGVQRQKDGGNHNFYWIMGHLVANCLASVLQNNKWLICFISLETAARWKEAQTPRKSIPLQGKLSFLLQILLAWLFQIPPLLKIDPVESPLHSKNTHFTSEWCQFQLVWAKPALLLSSEGADVFQVSISSIFLYEISSGCW